MITVLETAVYEGKEYVAVTNNEIGLGSVMTCESCAFGAKQQHVGGCRHAIVGHALNCSRGSRKDKLNVIWMTPDIAARARVTGRLS